MNVNRRQFERFSLPDDAIAYDDAGRRLGRVTVAGGGGMTIVLDDPGIHLAPGEHIRITVVEPEHNVRHTMDVIVRNLHERSLGVEFVSGRIAN